SNTKLPILSLKRKGKVLHRVEIALLYNRVKVYDSFDNCCLPKAALYSSISGLSNVDIYTSMFIRTPSI
ncbi:MAG: hypothetical protein ACL7BU_13485, partial [Candidatus Phlomobacter fragariae]